MDPKTMQRLENRKPLSFSSCFPLLAPFCALRKMLTGQPPHIPRQPQQPRRVFTVGLRSGAGTRQRLCSPPAPCPLPPTPTPPARSGPRLFPQGHSEGSARKSTTSQMMLTMNRTRLSICFVSCPVPGSPQGGGKVPWNHPAASEFGAAQSSP